MEPETNVDTLTYTAVIGGVTIIASDGQVIMHEPSRVYGDLDVVEVNAMCVAQKRMESQLVNEAVKNGMFTARFNKPPQNEPTPESK